MDKISEIRFNNREFTQMVFEMRLLMNKFNQSEQMVSISEATNEANSYFTENRSVFVFEQNNELLGYSVLKFEEEVCWLDWLFVNQDYHGQGIASKLFDHAEELAKNLGNDQLYVWVHPDNDCMLKFLKKKGYDVLNLLEVKKEKENPSTVISVLNNKFRY